MTNIKYMNTQFECFFNVKNINFKELLESF